ncbi:unnamed protein product [Urochloa humidicola]
MDKCRRYVCLVVNNLAGAYPLRRIDASSLFYPMNQAVNQVRFALPPDELQLPPPTISFSPSRSSFGKGILDFFGLFGHGQKKTLLAAMDYQGVSFMYDVDDCIITDITKPQAPKLWEPISVALGDALYVMDSKLIPGRRSCFDALMLGPSKDLLCTKSQWNWCSLQPPPFIFEPGYKTTRIGAYTVFGPSSILISVPNIGTYSFDTVSSSWNKAGDWELPFHGRADFISEYGVWLGFSAEGNQLCYFSDLRASMQQQQALDIVWDDPNLQLFLNNPTPLRYTCILSSQLVYLGSGKFCVAKLFERVENEVIEEGYLPQNESFVVLTGLVAKPGKFARGIEMTPHKSLLYKLGGIGNCWVF